MKFKTIKNDQMIKIAINYKIFNPELRNLSN